MTGWAGVVAMALVVRDEADIIATNLDYHLAQGVDVILVVDHGSSDATTEILRDYEQTGQVYAFRDDREQHAQADRINRLLRIAEESHAADWIVPCDGDEFWMPAAGSLRDVFAAVPDDYGYLRVERNNFLPVPDDGRAFHHRMVIRERRSVNLRGTVLEPKVALRPGAAAGVCHGNHDLDSPVMVPAPDIGAVAVGHFPMRTF
jgi:glycosyltransferase involved in cell wall biosynthesis